MSELNYLEILVDASTINYVIFFIKLYTGMVVGATPIAILLPIISKLKDWLGK